LAYVSAVAYQVLQGFSFVLVPLVRHALLCVDARGLRVVSGAIFVLAGGDAVLLERGVWLVLVLSALHVLPVVVGYAVVVLPSDAVTPVSPIVGGAFVVLARTEAAALGRGVMLVLVPFVLLFLPVVVDDAIVEPYKVTPPRLRPLLSRLSCRGATVRYGCVVVRQGSGAVVIVEWRRLDGAALCCWAAWGLRSWWSSAALRCIPSVWRGPFSHTVRRAPPVAHQYTYIYAVYVHKATTRVSKYHSIPTMPTP